MLTDVFIFIQSFPNKNCFNDKKVFSINLLKIYTPYRDVDPFIAAAIDAYTLDRCVWGSDWPFVRTEERVDYGPPLACLRRWLPAEADRHTVLWRTPAWLFGFMEG